MGHGDGSSLTTSMATHWLPTKKSTLKKKNGFDCLCLGTGDLVCLRSVLVPMLVKCGYKPAIIQTNQRSFVEHMIATSSKEKNQSDDDYGEYELETVVVMDQPSSTQQDGPTIVINKVPCWGAFSLGRDDDKYALVEELQHVPSVSMLGVDMTEVRRQDDHAAIASGENSPQDAYHTILKDLYDLLHLFCILRHDNTWSSSKSKICILIMDHASSSSNSGDDNDYIATLTERFLNEEKSDDNKKMMKDFLTNQVVFVESIVDRQTTRITDIGTQQQQSIENNNTMLPRLQCEALPNKALTIFDPHEDFTLIQQQEQYYTDVPGLVVRSTREQFECDRLLQSHILHGTQMARSHVLALMGIVESPTMSSDDRLSAPPVTNKEIVMEYLDSLVNGQAIPAIVTTQSERKTFAIQQEAKSLYEDWKRRFLHPNFGTNTFATTMPPHGGGGIPWGLTMMDTFGSKQQREQHPVSFKVSTAFAYAVMLRFLTPVLEGKFDPTATTVYTGWLEGKSKVSKKNKTDQGATTYHSANGLALRYHLEEGWYEFTCPIQVTLDHRQTTPRKPVSGLLLNNCVGREPSECIPTIRAYLLATCFPNGGCGGRASEAIEDLAGAIAVLYARLVAGDGLCGILTELVTSQYDIGLDTPCHMLAERSSSTKLATKGTFLEYHPNAIPDTSVLMKRPVVDLESVESIVTAAVQGAVAIDLHTHLLPPTHGSLCLWGIDELLTYHYLVAEYFMTAPASMIPEDFYAKTKQDQADLIWQALFLDRTPISEATRGVLTTLQTLGLTKELQTRDLSAIRAFYNNQYRSKGLEGSIEFCEMVFAKSGIEYAIMTNIPFDAEEAQYWRPYKKEYSPRFRSALRVDPLLTGDKAKIEAALTASLYETTLDGARQYLRDWCDTMQPCYMMASTPHNFVLKEGTLANVQQRGVNMDAMKEPFAFVDATKNVASLTCNGTEDDAPSIIDENSDFLSEVLMQVCQERDLPVALKIGAHRGVNPKLKAAGDGVVAFADAGMLGRLCSRFPKVRFLATFLSRKNQHEACVLASKFRNLHIYGCWWFCNNPSMIREITQMRVEMLGTAFTAQHSDARVLDQLLYKWPHSRAIIAQVLVEEFQKSIESGWFPTREEIRRDVRRLFRGSYEEFMAKSLLD